MFNMLSTQAQECLQNALNRYDYSDAIHIIDSLMATDKADSVGLALHKARCLKKLYRAEEAAETIAEVLHIDQFNVELMAELAECHMQYSLRQAGIIYGGMIRKEKSPASDLCLLTGVLMFNY